MNFPYSHIVDQVHPPADGPPFCEPLFNFDIPPLTFDRVHGGHLTTSNFPLFEMPVELLAYVTAHLSSADLKSLALVDRDCCRLAALKLFNEVQVPLCDESYRILVGDPAQSVSCIPRCVRKLTVSRRSTHVQPGVSSPTAESLNHRHSRLICGIIDTSLPNLHVLNWDGPVIITSSILSSLQSSPIKHLRLKGALHEPHVVVEPPNSPLPIETLCLEVSLPISPQPQPTDFYTNLFRLVAPTLRQLTWIGPLTENAIPIDCDIPIFSDLRSLNLNNVSAENDSLLRLFLGGKINVLSLSIDSASTSNFLRFLGNVSSLRHFCWINRESTTRYYDDLLMFICQNPQLETLQIQYPIPPMFTNQSLIPSLQNNFDALSSLHLVWDAADIPEHALRSLSSLSTLRRLWLSAGNQGSRSTWEIDHTAILQCLSPLHGLEMLAFSHDTYTMTVHPLAPRVGDYYLAKALPMNLDVSRYLTPAEFLIYEGRNVEYDLAVSQQIRLRQSAWEIWHSERMAEVANNYARTFNALRWCFIGQLALAPCDSKRAFSSIVGNPPMREPCLSALQRMMSIALWRP